MKRNYMLPKSFITLFLSCSVTFCFSQPAFVVSSPDKHITVTAFINPIGQATYKINYLNQPLLKDSRLGLVRTDEDFSDGLIIKNASATQLVKDQYELITGKKRNIQYTANRRVLHLQNKNGKPLDIIFQVSNDGVAFRYFFPNSDKEVKSVTEEVTSFHFDTAARAFLQPMQEAKTGWEHTNPAYEEHYLQNIPVTTASPTKAGWVYPALFKVGDTWVLLTEAALDTTYCGTRLQATSPGGEYRVGFPDPREVFTGGGYLPKSRLPFYSPWRVITLGSLKTVAESTLGTDLATPAIKLDASFIKPGKSSWSWIMSKDDSIVFSEQVRYIDMAAKMNWQYTLVDAAWDQKIGYEKIKELAAYAASKNVGLLLWYNSSGDWNTVKYSPKSKLLSHEDRVKEFSRLKEMGIKGVKIDFFGGDGQSMIKYYIDILKDAALYKLLVNFHGATLPRGWHRTYPHLLTTEAVKGFEMITFNQKDADAEANHCAMLPFTRNAFDPMDFTPMNLYKIPTRVKRKTTSGFELATSVLFLSGIQHMAESPKGMEQVPVYVKQFLQNLPNRWEDVRFLEGFPGRYIVIARKSGNKWYIAGINGENNTRSVSLDLSQYKKNKAVLITDGEQPLSFSEEQIEASGKKEITLKANGGFVLVLQ